MRADEAIVLMDDPLVILTRRDDLDA